MFLVVLDHRTQHIWVEYALDDGGYGGDMRYTVFSFQDQDPAIAWRDYLVRTMKYAIGRP